MTENEKQVPFPAASSDEAVETNDFSEERQWHILLVEDDLGLARSTKKLIERRSISAKGERAIVEVTRKFPDALGLLERQRFDLVVLDIRNEETLAELKAAVTPDVAAGLDSGDEVTEADQGLTVFADIRSRRFLPIVFYSAVPHLAQEHHNPPFVTVVSKSAEEDNALRDSIGAVFDSELPSISRLLGLHLDDIVRGFMIDFVEANWVDLMTPAGKADLAYLLVRRLARSLDATFIRGLLAEADPETSGVHPSRLFVMPPDGPLTTGDIVKTGDGSWAIVLTPACDFVLRKEVRKAEFVMTATCVPLQATPQFVKWSSSGSNDSARKLKELIENKPGAHLDRFYFLPAAWGTPALVVDLQQLHSVPYSTAAGYGRAASLDDPYAQAVVAQLGRFFGRMGTPDLDTEAVWEKLQHQTLSVRAEPPIEGFSAQ